ncbi:MAG: hypothetical protein ACO1OX_03015 [Novosphingobium sp.]
MIRTALVTAAASALVFHLGGCQKGPASPAPDTTTAAAAESGARVALAAATPARQVTPAVAPASMAKRPEEVIDAFAAAIEARDWRSVRAFWGDSGNRSGMDGASFAKKWGSLKAPSVVVGEGQQEGAAGSIYYTAPVVITDGDRTVNGEVVLRRVNNVPSATPEQLRWHVDSTTLVP